MYGIFHKIDLEIVGWGFSSLRQVKSEIKQLEGFDVSPGVLQAIKLKHLPKHELDFASVENYNP